MEVSFTLPVWLVHNWQGLVIGFLLGAITFVLLLMWKLRGWNPMGY